MVLIVKASAVANLREDVWSEMSENDSGAMTALPDSKARLNSSKDKRWGPAGCDLQITGQGPQLDGFWYAQESSEGGHIYYSRTRVVVIADHYYPEMICHDTDPFCAPEEIGMLRRKVALSPTPLAGQGGGWIHVNPKAKTKSNLPDNMALEIQQFCCAIDDRSMFKRSRAENTIFMKNKLNHYALTCKGDRATVNERGVRVDDFVQSEPTTVRRRQNRRGSGNLLQVPPSPGGVTFYKCWRDHCGKKGKVVATSHLKTGCCGFFGREACDLCEPCYSC